MSLKQGSGNKIVLVDDSGCWKFCILLLFITGNFNTNANTTKGASYSSQTVEFSKFKKYGTWYTGYRRTRKL